MDEDLDKQDVTAAIVDLAGWDRAVSDDSVPPGYGRGLVTGGTRVQITPSVAHYQFDVRYGPGEYEVFRLHRVVKERRPHRPIRAKKNIFLQHGREESLLDAREAGVDGFIIADLPPEAEEDFFSRQRSLSGCRRSYRYRSETLKAL